MVALRAPTVPNIPKVHQYVVTKSALMDAKVREGDDEFDPLFTYPSPSRVAAPRNDGGETLVGWVERSLLDQRVPLRIKLVNREVPTGVETLKVTHGPSRGKMPDGK